MTRKGQMLVALAAMSSGLVALGLYWLIARPDVNNATVAIGTLVYATAYVLIVPRAERLLIRKPGYLTGTGEGLHQG